MAPRRTQQPPTPPSTSVPQRTGDPNQPGGGFEGWDQPIPGGGDQGESNVADNYKAYYEEKFNEAWVYLRENFSAAQRTKVLKELWRKGIGSSAEVSPLGFADYDVDRFAQVLIYAEMNNRSVNSVLETDLNKVFSNIRSDSPSMQKTPQQDVDRVFADVMRVKIGRGPTAEERERFRNAYAGMEATGAAPSVAGAAEEQIMKVNTDEERANRFSGYMDVFQQMLRGA